MDIQYYDLDDKYSKLTFPKTFEECCNVLNISTELPNFHRFDLHLFYQLITCVKAYHKICNYTANFKEDTTKFVIWGPGRLPLTFLSSTLITRIKIGG